MSSYPEKLFIAANDEYAKNFTKTEGELPLPPGKHYAIGSSLHIFFPSRPGSNEGMRK